MPLPAVVARAADALRAFDRPWAVAGGWALDLALGRVTRPHGDVDVAIFRDDQDALRIALADWRFERAAAGAWVSHPASERLAWPDHVALAHPPDGGDPIEILLNERTATDWVYRRDPAVVRPLARAFVTRHDDLRLLAPEIVLLYKSKAPRPSDEHDFAVGRALLDVDAAAWLHAALRRASPDHPWLRDGD
jgi:hypothetical protein